ncbi:MAG: sulfotransferase [Paracoccaceae bacterium]
MATDPRAEAQKISALLQAGQFRAAHKAAKGAMKRFPKEAFFANLAGVALVQSGDSRGAVACFQKAVKLNPGFAEAARNLGQALVETGRTDAAVTLAERLVVKWPRDPAIWQLRAVSAYGAGDAQGAEDAAARAIELDPGDAEPRLLRGSVRLERGDARAALEDFEAARSRAPADPEIPLRISHALVALGRDVAALEAIDGALKAAPAHPDLLHRRALLLNEAGARAAALEGYRRLLQVVPGHPEALRALVSLQDREENAALLPEIQAALKAAPGTGPARLHLAHAAARIHDQQDEREAAARLWAEANAADARARPHDFAHAEAQCERILAAFPENAAPVESPPVEEPAPIFVLGMMRSGTTLTEQILAAHPAIHGAGELSAAARLLVPQTEAGAPFDAEAAAAFARDWRASLPALPDGIVAFVDKMPANYRLIGYLLTAFPNARIVHLSRDPREVAFSIWREHFPGAALTFTADLRAIAQMANLHQRYMAHWHRVFPGQILDLPYARLVQDIEGESRRLAAHVGVAWDPAMARPERNMGAVRTASVNQVREGVHTRSLGSWRRYETMLEPFIAALDPALWPELDRQG